MVNHHKLCYTNISRYKTLPHVRRTIYCAIAVVFILFRNLTKYNQQNCEYILQHDALNLTNNWRIVSLFYIHVLWSRSILYILRIKPYIAHNKEDGNVVVFGPGDLYELATVHICSGIYC